MSDFFDLLDEHGVLFTDDELYTLAQAGARHLATKYRQASDEHGELGPIHDTGGRTMRAAASQLEFISRIERNGSGCVFCDGDASGHGVQPHQVFFCYALSLTEGTWIAHGFNSFVVRLRYPKSRQS